MKNVNFDIISIRRTRAVYYIFNTEAGHSPFLKKRKLGTIFFCSQNFKIPNPILIKESEFKTAFKIFSKVKVLKHLIFSRNSFLGDFLYCIKFEKDL